MIKSGENVRFSVGRLLKEFYDKQEKNFFKINIERFFAKFTNNSTQRTAVFELVLILLGSET